MSGQLSKVGIAIEEKAIDAVAKLVADRPGFHEQRVRIDVGLRQLLEMLPFALVRQNPPISRLWHPPLAAPPAGGPHPLAGPPAGGTPRWPMATCS